MLAITDLRFFIHDVRLVDNDGRETKVPFVPDGRWQTAAVSLLDFAPDCRKPRPAHPRIDIELPDGQWKALRFRLGVPGDIKHASAPDSTRPLSWSTGAGFKFLKLEARRGEVPIHVALGEEGCEELFTDGKECNGPRLADITVPWGPGPVVVELSDLIETKEGAEAVNCMGAADPSCARAYAALGLKFRRGSVRGAQSP